MTTNQLEEARATADQQFLNGAIDGNRYLDLLQRLKSDPDEFWALYFDGGEDFIRQEARRLMAQHGPNLTFADVQRVMRTEARNARMCRTRRRQ